MLELLLILILRLVSGQHDGWWYDQGNDWDTSDYLSAINPFYQTYKHASAQMDMYGYAKHVGKINRGKYSNPELNLPANRAHGYHSDFNPADYHSGAFRHQPKGQRYIAKPAHVNAGLASHVGEILTMPVGQHVQGDGTVLVQVDGRQADPCLPNPCTYSNLPRCEVVHDGTVKCARSETFKLTFTWVNPDADGNSNELDLIIVASFHDGSKCKYMDSDMDSYSGLTGEDVCEGHNYDASECKAISCCHWNSDPGDSGFNMCWSSVGQGSCILPNQACGVVMGGDAVGYDFPGREVETAELKDDGSSWHNHAYAIIAYYYDYNRIPSLDDYNLSEGSPMLIVTDDDGDSVQVLTVPQFDEVTNLNNEWREYFFFGCFRSPLGEVDIKGAGFYDRDTEILNTGLTVMDAGLCKALLESPSHPGYTPYPQITPFRDETLGACIGLPGQRKCCTPDAPCPYHGGDCKQDSSCQGDLVCGHNNCRALLSGPPFFLSEDRDTWGVDYRHDCCVTPAEKKAQCQGRKGEKDCCKPFSRCQEGGGNCKQNNHCAGSLICGSNSDCKHPDAKPNARCCKVAD